MSKAIWRIEKSDLCRGLNAMEIQHVTKISQKICFQKGDIITDVKNRSRDIFVLINGYVDIMSLHGVSLYRVSSGEIFGELALVPNVKRSAVAIAREDSWVLIVNINHLESLGEEVPTVYKKVLDNVILSLGIKLARANKLIELLKTELTKQLKSQY